ncbi:MAG TPA: PAS domain S-box protein [Gaiellaceae bacterium]|jgi:PAS domain S-box-containing protein|nr:PAS domain S-box protein [Gaiellaceae bacterium]
MPLYEIVLRREGFADEVRLTDHVGFSVGDSIQVGRHDCLVTSTDESSQNLLVSQRVICTLAMGTHPRGQKLLGEALDRLQVAAFVFDAEGVVAAANEAATTMTGYSRAELAELDSASLLAEPAVAPAQLASVSAGSFRSGDGAIRQKNGTVLPVRFHVDTATLASGETYYLSFCWPLA